MSYVKNTWQTGDIITASKMNNIEEGIEAASQGGGGGGGLPAYDSYSDLNKVLMVKNVAVSGTEQIEPAWGDPIPKNTVLGSASSYSGQYQGALVATHSSVYNYDTGDNQTVPYMKWAMLADAHRGDGSHSYALTARWNDDDNDYDIGWDAPGIADFSYSDVGKLLLVTTGTSWHGGEYISVLGNNSGYAQMLTVNSTGRAQLTDLPEELPDYSNASEGAVLTIVNGVPTWVAPQ